MKSQSIESAYDVIINGLVKGGYTAKESEELITTFMEEQRILDELRDSLHSLISYQWRHLTPCIKLTTL